jgi:hypothetical protein
MLYRSSTTVLPVAVGITNGTQLIESTMEEDNGLVAGIVIAVVTIILILAALVSKSKSIPIALYCPAHTLHNAKP